MVSPKLTNLSNVKAFKASPRFLIPLTIKETLLLNNSNAPASPPACSAQDKNLIPCHTVASVPITLAIVEIISLFSLHQSEKAVKPSVTSLIVSASNFNASSMIPPSKSATVSILMPNVLDKNSAKGFQLPSQSI
ncbi:Uncharacterised protein [Streptococcus pneumoniae]|nr:Uncharacterised protein [Streptococcus pneumoniae]CAG5470256.1 Uncharacterised protein [Streptococcus pneumoniae]CAG5657416.1 Uncharacterised protein [Streptococcus pneumoniae]CAG5956508.1 Uncharacterised protein [Streptococcus pneumoniae]CAG6261544.1 Uncharacterised protein [Streptococcus pneumoniae]